MFQSNKHVREVNQSHSAFVLSQYEDTNNLNLRIHHLNLFCKSLVDIAFGGLSLPKPKLLGISIYSFLIYIRPESVLKLLIENYFHCVPISVTNSKLNENFSTYVLFFINF